MKIDAVNRHLIHNSCIDAKLAHLERKAKQIAKDAAALRHSIRLLVQDRTIACIMRRKRTAATVKEMYNMLCGAGNECRDIRQQLYSRIRKANRRIMMANNRLARLRSLGWKLQAIQQAAAAANDAVYAAAGAADAAYIEEWLDGHLPPAPVTDTPAMQDPTP